MGIRWVAVALLAVGCGFEPEGAVPFDPPPEYRAWFEATMDCSERQGRFEDLQWFSVPGREFSCPTGQCVGRWEPGHRIYLGEFWIGHEMVVRHEMLHDLIGRSGHPDPPFGAGCPLTWDSWRADHPTGRLAPGPAID